jgi:predicted ester cyclase
MFTPGYIDRNPFPCSTLDLPGYKQGLTEFRATFPDFHCTIEDEISVGDRLVHRLPARGTQKGELMGAAATSAQATWSEDSHRALCQWQDRGELARQ